MTRPLLAALLFSASALAYPPESVWNTVYLKHQAVAYSARDWLFVPDPGQTFVPMDVYEGDSNFERMTVSAIHAGAENFGISGANTMSVLKRLTGRNTSRRARTVLLHVGVNDCVAIARGKWTMEDVREAVSMLPTKISRPIVWAGVHQMQERGTRTNNPLPLYNECIDEVNAIEEAACASVPHCVWVPSPLTSGEHYTDGIHPSPAGYALWMKALREGLARVGVVP